MLKFPYGIGDFESIITEQYFYVDRTDRIRLFEKIGKILLFLRPRRFGKSLLLSILENYYDVTKAERFEELFGHLAIGRQPTPRHNQYIILRWNFSLVDPHGELEAIQKSLYDHLNSGIYACARWYADVLPYDVQIDRSNALFSLESLLAAVRASSYKLYLLIDEYDNFANEVLMAGRASSTTRYQTLIEGEGMLKTVFKTIKAGTEGRGIDRVFLTGVSPIVMSDVTSGFNISENLSLLPEFHDLCGFWESEVAATLDRVAEERSFSEEQTQEALAMMRTLYNGYRFHAGAAGKLYNPTLVLYFLKYLQRQGEYPEEPLDENFAMDRAKIGYISGLPEGEALICKSLNEQAPVTIQHLANRFDVRQMLQAAKDQTFMASLLYYFGVLTLEDRTPQGAHILGIPNLVVRRLYLERLHEMLTPAQQLNEAHDTAEKFYGSGDMTPVCEFIEQTYFRVFDNRDYKWTNELTIKTVFLTLLFNDFFYLMDSEPALERGYADLIMIIRPDMRQYQLLDFLLEFKYVGLKQLGLTSDAVRGMSREELCTLAPVKAKLAESQRKLREYHQTLRRVYGDKLRLRVYSIVAIGFDRLIWQAMPQNESDSSSR